MGRLCREAREMDIPLEVNMLGIEGRAIIPATVFLNARPATKLS